MNECHPKSHSVFCDPYVGIHDKANKWLINNGILIVTKYKAALNGIKLKGGGFEGEAWKNV